MFVAIYSQLFRHSVSSQFWDVINQPISHSILLVIVLFDPTCPQAMMHQAENSVSDVASQAACTYLPYLAHLSQPSPNSIR